MCEWLVQDDLSWSTPGLLNLEQGHSIPFSLHKWILTHPLNWCRFSSFASAGRLPLFLNQWKDAESLFSFSFQSPLWPNVFTLYMKATWFQGVTGYYRNPIHFYINSYMLPKLCNKVVASQSCCALIHEREATFFNSSVMITLPAPSVLMRILWLSWLPAHLTFQFCLSPGTLESICITSSWAFLYFA